MFTAIAVFTVGLMERDVGGYQDSRRHLREAGRRALGARHFNQAFAAGAKLNQRDPVAIPETRDSLDVQAS